MGTDFKTFFKDARTSPLSWKGAFAWFYGVNGLIFLAVLVAGFLASGKVELQSVQTACFMIWISTAVGLRGGLWKEQTQTAADRHV